MEHDGERSDEVQVAPIAKKRDMDACFFVGCTTIAVFSVVFFVLEAWPFFVFRTSSISGLWTIALTGCLPSLLVGAVVVRKFSLEGATAFIGGTVSASVFAFLRMDMLELGRFGQMDALAVPDYPAFWVWLMPAAWALLVTSLALFLLPQAASRDEVSPQGDR